MATLNEYVDDRRSWYGAWGSVLRAHWKDDRTPLPGGVIYRSWSKTKTQEPQYSLEELLFHTMRIWKEK